MANRRPPSRDYCTRLERSARTKDIGRDARSARTWIKDSLGSFHS
jgi:hypothetical protein